ncbi:klaroid protein [Anopheles nili]|uniref:klaroid protein n=1 Tax=Anopheles nili TaxID=185578 RepID=UPI00237AE109|nr:klaroid protein [Anopheles nili]
MSEPQSITDVIETRRRSRSKTPSIVQHVSSERDVNGAESGLRKVRKTPAVGTIEEEDPSVVNAKSIPGRTTPLRKIRVVTSDYSSDDVSPEHVRQLAGAMAANANTQLAKMSGQQQLSQSAVTTTTSTTTTEQTTVILGGGKEKVNTVQITHTSSSGNDRGQEVLSTSPKKDASSVKTALGKQEEVRTTTRSSKTSVSTGTSVIRTSTPKYAAQKMHSAKVVLTPEELQQHAAYKEYLEAGEYWNKYPKTDYTYSELSPHRREVAPGLVAMPNMSRPSLNKHAERVQTMIQQNPDKEAYIRERYTSARSRFMRSDPYESTDEVDELPNSSRYNSGQRRQQQRITIEHQSIVSRFFLSIVTFCFTCVDTVRSVFRRREEEHLYYTRIEDERSFLVRVYGFVSSLFINVFKRIYLLVSSVLFLDAWLLQTSAANSDQQQANQRKRRFLLFLLMLLPFLLIGAYLLAEDDQTIVLPASSRATLALSSISNILPATIKDSEMNIKSLYRYIAMMNQKLSDSSVASLFPSFGWLSTLTWPWSWSWLWSGWNADARHGSINRETIRSTLQNTLSKKEFDELILHIDAYIDGVMEQKYALKTESARQMFETGRQITPEITFHVAQVIEESLKSYNYQLTDSDIDKVAEKVRQAMLTSYPEMFMKQSKTEDKATPEGGKVKLSKEYVLEIQRVVEQQITVHNNQYLISGPQLEELLTQILSSDRLSTLIDERIIIHRNAESNERVTDVDSQHNALVEDLRKEMNDIKAHFSEQLLSNSLQWEERLETMKQNHVHFSEQLRLYKLENNDLYQKLLADIDERLSALREEKYEGVNKVIRENIITILGLNVKQDIAEEDLRAWMNGLFVARDHLEQRLAEIQARVDVNAREEIDRTASSLMNQVGEKIHAEIEIRMEEARQAQIVATSQTTVSPETTSSVRNKVRTTSSLTEDDVKRIVRDALIVYDADKTGMVDYALESAGGQVLSTRCTESYQASSAELRIFGIIPIWYSSNTPRTVISPTMEPGQCWAFQGFPGYLVIQLNTEVIVTGFTLEHISKLLVSNGSISSAPRHFTVWGLLALNDPEPVQLGSYEYLDKMGTSVQYFPVQNQGWNQPLQIVELRIESNHGNIHYTCLYRFRVHGEKV